MLKGKTLKGKTLKGKTLKGKTLKGKTLKGLVVCVALTTLLSGCSFSDLGDKINQLRSKTGVSDTAQQVVLSPLTGLAVDEATFARRPLAVMINNATAARPQSGLDKADVVYEFLAEGGVTRLMAIYLHQDASEVGPVRSARPYFVHKALEYDALYAHCGGSEDAKGEIASYGVADLDEFKIGKKAFWRTTDRVAPHNLYTSTDNLWSYAGTKGLNNPVKLQGFKFLDETEATTDTTTDNQQPPVENIHIKYSSESYNVTYKYSPEKNSYLRYNGSSAHMDKVTGKQLNVKNIIIQYAETVTYSDTRLAIDLLGQGQALLFSDGKVIKGMWSKNSVKEQTIFYDETGAEFKLLPGQTWIQVVPTTNAVTY